MAEQLSKLIAHIGEVPRAQQLHLLERLLNALAQQDVVSAETLRCVAQDVMAMEYREDEDLLCFNCYHDGLHEH